MALYWVAEMVSVMAWYWAIVRVSRMAWYWAVTRVGRSAVVSDWESTTEPALGCDGVVALVSSL